MSKLISPIHIPGITKSRATKDNLDSRNMVWSTSLVEEYVDRLENGKELNMPSPFLKGEMGFRDRNIRFKYTDAEVDELKRCQKDPYYFANKYAYALTDEGIRQIQLKDYQEEMFDSFHTGRFTILLASRQMGKTTAAAIYIVWYICFHLERNVLITGDTARTAMEVMDRVKMIYSNLPYFIKPGILVNNVHDLKFDNGCSIMAQPTTTKTGRGKTIHLLYADEFAHVDENIADKFYQSIFPTISASSVSKMIITSTPNGPNLFYKLWVGANNNENNFNPVRVDYWRHPDRNAEWERSERKSMANDERFDVEYGLKFFTGAKALFDESKLEQLQKSIEKYTFIEIPEIHDRGINYSGLTWNSNFRILDIQPHDQFVISVDLAEGTGGDYTVFNIFKIELMSPSEMSLLVDPSNYHDFFKLKQVALFRDNNTNIDMCANILADLVVNYFKINNTKIVMEDNFKGDDFRSKFMKTQEYKDKLYIDIFFKSKHSKLAFGKKPGIRMKEDNKPIFCSNLRNLMASNKIQLSEDITIREVSTFSKNERGKWITETGNDDIAMTCVLLSPYLTSFDEKEDESISPEFSEQLSEIIENSSGDILKILEAQLDTVIDDFYEIKEDLNTDYSSLFDGNIIKGSIFQNQDETEYDPNKITYHEYEDKPIKKVDPDDEEFTDSIFNPNPGYMQNSNRRIISDISAFSSNPFTK